MTFNFINLTSPLPFTLPPLPLFTQLYKKLVSLGLNNNHTKQLLVHAHMYIYFFYYYYFKGVEGADIQAAQQQATVS